jgi:predicted ATPase
MDPKIDTIKLDLSADILYGRSNEVASLHEAFEAVRNEELGNNEVRRLMVLHGSSGSGKTALAHSLRTLIQNNNGFFAEGKFDLATAGIAPYVAFATACNSLCEQIATSEESGTICERVKDALGRGKVNFQHFVPNVSNLIPGSVSDEIAGRKEWGLDQLKVQLCEFLRAICGSSNPREGRKVVVFFLDDLQWADQGSLDVLRFLAADRQSHGLLLLTAFRDEDIDGSSTVEQELRLIEKDMCIARIHVKELNQAGVSELIAGVTDLNVKDTDDLADVVFRKTRGNVFFVLQLLKIIEDEGLLYFSGVTLRWEWDLAAIESETPLADNAVGIVAQKIQRLPQHAKDALKIAACLGSSIDTRIVDYIASQGAISIFAGLNVQGDVLTRENRWIKIFDLIAGEGLVNKRKRGSRSYVWSHDKIQEGAYSLIASDADKELLHHQIGEALKRMEDCPLGEQWKLTAATDQLNRAANTITDENERVELAKMNLTASRIVASISAFYPAARYLKAGIDLLETETRWSKNYDLCLEIHSSLAEMEKYVGHHSDCRKVVDEVLQHAHNLDDKSRSYMALIESLGAQGQFKEGIDIAIDLARRMGERLPRNPSKYSVMLEVLRTKRAVGRKTDDQLLNLPTATDANMLRVFSLYSRLRRLTWSGGQIRLSTLLKARMMRLFMRHGVNEFGGPVFAGYGSVLSRMGQVDEAYRFGCLALKLCERFPVEESQTLTLVCVYLQIVKKPLRHSIEMLLRAHRIGMEKGDIEFSFLAAVSYCVFYFYHGLPLGPMQEDAKAFANLMRQYGNVVTLNHLSFYRQLALNFMGQSENFLILSGEALNLEKVEKEAIEQRNHLTLLFSWTAQLVLACFSFDVDLSTTVLRKLEKVDLLPENFPGPTIIGLTSAFLARSTGLKKYVKQAKQAIKKLDAVLRKGSVNYLHFQLLTKAEIAAFEGREDLAKKLFEGAMRASGQAGFTNFEALTNERAGLYALERDSSNLFWASTYLSRAVWLYSEWGAQAKVDLLRQKYPLLTANTAPQGPVSSNHQGRRRFDRTLADRHRGSWRTERSISFSSLRAT